MDGGADGFWETERKYEVGADYAVPDLTGLPGVTRVGPPLTFQLRATYYDTPGLELAGARITLRRRRGGPDEGWHLKLPAGRDTRREIHEPLRPGDEEAVPARLAGLVAGQAGRGPLHPIAVLATIRTVVRLAGLDGVELAEVADDQVSGMLPAGRGGAGPAGAEPAAGGPAGWREAARWREVEVELLEGPRDLLEAAGAALVAAGAKPAALGSKLARLLASA